MSIINASTPTDDKSVGMQLMQVYLRFFSTK